MLQHPLATLFPWLVCLRTYSINPYPSLLFPHASCGPPTIVPVPKKAKVTELNDYCPVGLTSVITKCFERLVKDHITSTLPDTLDPLQFAYRPNRSTDDTFSITLHTALTHLDERNTYVRMLFINYSSAFNTILPSNLIKL